ncbi:hypothetical protein APHAL10511_000471 [Amanita phalloides]|nr:hypothetical protein APHAL10511_000471 [Amanita phalloides]
MLYGNYHGYYSKRPAANDARLSVLPKTLFSGATVLDIGCNEGWVTCEIAQRLGARKVVGVDIDERLVNGAWRRRRAVWSLQGNGDDGDGDWDYFPASCEHEFGSLPVPPAAAAVLPAEKHGFPHNVAFRTVDWVEEEMVEDKEGYDVVMALSLTKWVHLNKGDEGLERLFRRVYRVLRSGGTFVLEPQPWETYAKAKRQQPRLRETGHVLQLHPDEFPELLESIGFEFSQDLGLVGDGGFSRPIVLYTKP